MSIYTYEISKRLSEIFNVDFDEISSISDQELQKIPKITKENIFANTDYVSGMVWITDGENNRYMNPNELMPTGWRRGRTLKKHMAKTDPKKWSEICKKSAEKQWKNAEQRKKKHSEQLKEYWTNNYNSMSEKSRKNGKHGMFGKLHQRSLLIEYKGVEYYGWRELKEATGITKKLYIKYYLNGIDPEPRIGKNGPAPSQSTVDILHQGGSA